MIKIKFLDNNMFLVHNNGGQAYFNTYINIIFSKLFNFAKPNHGKGGGWIFPYSRLEDVKACFNDIVYENEYNPPDYMNIGKDMKLQPYEYQKEAINFAINNNEGLLVLPCGAGKTPIMIGTYLELKSRGVIDDQGLIIVKASLKSQWKNEVEKFSHLSANIIQTHSDRCSNISNRMKTVEKKLKKLDIVKDAEQRKELAEKINELKKEAEDLFNSQFENVDLLIANYETLLDEAVLNRLIYKKIQCIMCDEIIRPAQ